MRGNLIMSPENMRAFERSIDMLESSLREIRRVAYSMMPEVLVNGGPDMALRGLPTKLFVTDEHYMVIEGFRALLRDRQDIEWIGHATNAASCLAFLQQQLPDVMLIGIHLPDMSGSSLCSMVKENYPSIGVIGISTFSRFSETEKMMASGAAGYVLRNATREELMEAIQAALLKNNR